ncbi:hypothetical protein KC19_10G061400 [Ceratodon purpureus]|uniref:Secreted protein n=1 Tax=Ceratodon purpureus TaxID=3225 RepID=A0A8T0GL09_CERPU|nr:hypothetical protein KC19_10G061400 [Ceratodon purpureus]
MPCPPMPCPAPSAPPSLFSLSLSFLAFSLFRQVRRRGGNCKGKGKGERERERASGGESNFPFSRVGFGFSLVSLSLPPSASPRSSRVGFGLPGTNWVPRSGYPCNRSFLRVLAG